MVKSEKQRKRYTYGNVAYDIEPEIKEKSQKIHKKKRNNKKNLKVKLKLMSTIITIFLISFLLVCRFTTIISMSNEVRQIRAQVEDMQKENDNIKVEIATLNNIKNIEDIAVSKEGMIAPNPDEIYYVKVKPLTLPVEKQKASAFHTIQKFLGLIY